MSTRTISSEVAVHLRDLAFGYPQSNPLYAGFNLEIQRGRVTAIMGGSGSGKSTLGKLLGGELFPDGGDVLWSEALAEERDHFYIDQDPKKVFYPHQTVSENLAYAPRKRRIPGVANCVNQLLSDFRLAPVRDSFPLYTSGGQQSRLALARVLSWEPKGIILDEYLSSLDVNTRELIMENLQQLVAQHGMTVVMITHNLTEALRLADRCVILGTQPVKVLADIEIDLPHPRNRQAAAYQAAENALIDALRHGLL